jgi:hypothetical protein
MKNIPVTEIPARAAHGEQLALVIHDVRELVELRMGFRL